MELLLLVPTLALVALLFIAPKMISQLNSDDKEWHTIRESNAKKSNEAVEEIERKEKDMKLKGEWLAENPKPKNKWCGCSYVFKESYYSYSDPDFRWENENKYSHDQKIDREKGTKTEYCDAKNKMQKIKYKEVK